MIAFQRILFPVDFSKQDHEAASSVKAMAELHSEVMLMHVAEFVFKIKESRIRRFVLVLF